MSLLKCPNPDCPHQFDPTQVPAGATLACPRCGQRFALAPPPARHASRGTGSGSMLVAVGGVLLLLGLIAAAMVLSGVLKTGGGRGGEEPAAKFQDADRNFAFVSHGLGWQRDPGTAARMGVTVLALHRPDPPEAWAALSVSDYKDRSPLTSELVAKVTEHLGRVFQSLPPELPVEPTTWAGQPALRFRFRGELKATGAVCSGEAHAMGYRGVGYWLYAWSAERDEAAAADELARVRDGFRLLGGRTNWSDRGGAEVLFRGPSGKYRLTGYEKIWQVQPTPADDPPTPDLELLGTLGGKNRDYSPRATVLVWVVPGPAADDPLVVADRFVRTRYTRDEETFGRREVTVVAEPPAGDPPVGPEGTGRRTARLRVTPADPNATGSASKLVVYAALPTDDGLVIAEASCPWAERPIWERRLVQFVGSLRP